MRTVRRPSLVLLFVACACTTAKGTEESVVPPYLAAHGYSLSLIGILTSLFAALQLASRMPVGIAYRADRAKRQFALALAVCGLATSGFAFANGFWPLAAARFLQGCGSGFTWAGAFAWLLAAAPRERRGEMIGSAMGAAVFGALCGPVGGGVAVARGRAPVFAALSGLAVVLGWLTQKQLVQGLTFGAVK